MSGPASFIDTEQAIAWVGQFGTDDQADAVALLQAMTLVTRDEFAERLTALLRQRGRAGAGPVALYAEGELPREFGIPDRLFEESTTKAARRAVGVGPQPVKPTSEHDPEVGSEGLVAQLITELCRQQGNQFLNHPGPDEIRRHRVRRFMVVTDLIGSGRRARDYLEAAWRVRSVRSWTSWRLLGFEVIAYAATNAGRRVVEAHHSRPVVEIVSPCPTIDAAFRDEAQARIRNLCMRYDPIDHDPVRCFGVGGLGALIAFAHGVPNNAPRILHKTTRRWVALFPGRVTAGVREQFGNSHGPEFIAARLRKMRQTKLASGPWLQQASPDAQSLMLVTAALARGPRTDEAIARRTGLTILDVRRWVAEAGRLDWIDAARRLTDRGQSELAHARRRTGAIPAGKKTLTADAKDPYYPQSLRAPLAV